MPTVKSYRKRLSAANSKYRSSYRSFEPIVTPKIKVTICKSEPVEWSIKTANRFQPVKPTTIICNAKPLSINHKGAFYISSNKVKFVNSKNNKSNNSCSFNKPKK